MTDLPNLSGFQSPLTALKALSIYPMLSEPYFLSVLIQNGKK